MSSKIRTARLYEAQELLENALAVMRLCEMASFRLSEPGVSVDKDELKAIGRSIDVSSRLVLDALLIVEQV